jgi:hypothetical protein
MSDGVKKTFKDYPPQDEARTRWTRPTIRELGCVQVTESGTHNGLLETATYNDNDAS